MDMDRKKIIIEILEGFSVRMREGYFKKNHNSILTEINNFCDKIIDLPFNQRIWHWVNNYPNYFTCRCGNLSKFNRNWLDGYKKHCSAKCAQSDQVTKDKRRNTNIEKYGVDNVAKSDIIKKKQEETNIKKYGYKSSFQNLDVRNKWSDNLVKNYGVDHPFKLDLVKEKSIETMNQKYGSDYYVQSSEYIIKAIESNRDKFGVDWYTQTEDWLIRTIESNRDKFGVDWFTQTEDYRKYLKSEEFKSLVKEKTFQISIDHYKKYGFELLSSDNGIIKLKGECGHEFETNCSLFSSRKFNNIPNCIICHPLNSQTSSKEFELIEWIKSLNIDIEVGKRDIISPKEIDIFVPSKNIAIEYNGLYWHSELFKDKRYHLNKMLSCESKNIELIQVWEDDWLNKNKIIKSIIKNRLGLIQNKIWARKCKIRENMDKDEVNLFFNENHIQGSTKYKISIGLYYDNRLVSCMLFNKPKKDLELVRFSNIIDNIVVGSASKLFNYYIKKYNVSNVVSFADRSIFNGNLYKELGFKFQYRTIPNYWWVINNCRKHRFNFNKKKLISKGFDPNLTGVEMMSSIGSYRIYGVGLDKYVFNI